MEYVPQEDHTSREYEVQNANGDGDGEDDDDDDEYVFLQLVLGAPSDLAALGLQTLPPSGDLCAVLDCQDTQNQHDKCANTQVDDTTGQLLFLGGCIGFVRSSLPWGVSLLRSIPPLQKKHGQADQKSPLSGHRQPLLWP